MIRFATDEDMPLLAEKGRPFYEATIYAERVPYDPSSAELTLREVSNSESGVVLVYGDHDGFLAGLLAPVYANRNYLQAHELFWWVEPNKRGSQAGVALMIAFERWAKDKGADVIAMSSLDTLHPERVAGLYRKAGYRPSEHLFVKSLEEAA